MGDGGRDTDCLPPTSDTSDYLSPLIGDGKRQPTPYSSVANAGHLQTQSAGFNQPYNNIFELPPTSNGMSLGLYCADVLDLFDFQSALFGPLPPLTPAIEGGSHVDALPSPAESFAHAWLGSLSARDSTSPLHSGPPPLPSFTFNIDAGGQAALADGALSRTLSTFFNRLAPTMPVFSRAWLADRLSAREHNRNIQFAAMCLAISAVVRIQPIHSAEVPEMHLQEARELLNVAVGLHSSTQLGQSPTVDSILTSFYIFACLFGLSERGAAWLRLQEAISLAELLGLSDAKTYRDLDPVERDQRRRLYLLLSITERYEHFFS